MADFIVVNTPYVPGYRVLEIKGIVMGLTARTRGVGGRIVAGLQTLTGGEVSAYTSEIYKARREAIDRMIQEARELGANAAIGMDIETSEVFQGVVLISATGTAVVVEQE